MANDYDHIRPWRAIERRKCRQIMVGSVPVGGDAPIAVQSMTNTLTHDVAATVKQTQDLEAAGADIVRISCPDPESSKALKDITREVTVPIVADIHFHYMRGIEAAQNGAACLRINPGNIGGQHRVKEVAPSASGSMQALWSVTCWRNTESPARMLWSRARSCTPACCWMKISTNLKSA